MQETAEKFKKRIEALRKEAALRIAAMSPEQKAEWDELILRFGRKMNSGGWPAKTATGT